MAEFKSIEDARLWVAQDLKRMVEHGAGLVGKTPPTFHYLIADFMQGWKPRLDTIDRHYSQWEYDPADLAWIGKVKKLLGFRYAAKSWMLRQRRKFIWLRNPWAQFIIHSSTDPMAKRHAKAQLDELRADPLTAHLAPTGANASDYEYTLVGVEHEQGQSLISAGVKTSLTGSRCDFYDLDDPEPDNDPNAMHERIIDVMQEADFILHPPTRHLKRMGAPSVPACEVTQLMVVGQPHHPGTAYVVQEGEHGHPLSDAIEMIVPVIGKDGRFVWPEIMSEKYFDYRKNRPKTPDEVKKGMTTEKWQCQFMINPHYMEDAGQVLFLKEIERVIKPVSNAVMSIDPADGGDCEWGVAVGGMVDHRFGQKAHILYMGGFVGEAYEGDFDDYSIFESVWSQIFALADEFGVTTILLERNLKAAYTACHRYLRKTNTTAIIVPVSARSASNKLRRIKNCLEQPINSGMVSAAPHVVGDLENHRQLSRLQHDKLPVPCDRIDALAQLLDHLATENPMAFGSVDVNLEGLRHMRSRTVVRGRAYEFMDM